MHIQIIITNCYIIENFIDDSNDNSLEEIELNSRTNFRNVTFSWYGDPRQR